MTEKTAPAVPTRIDRRAVLASAGAIALASADGVAHANETDLPVGDPQAFLLRQFADADVVLLSEDRGVRRAFVDIRTLYATVSAA